MFLDTRTCSTTRNRSPSSIYVPAALQKSQRKGPRCVLVVSRQSNQILHQVLPRRLQLLRRTSDRQNRFVRSNRLGVLGFGERFLLGLRLDDGALLAAAHGAAQFADLEVAPAGRGGRFARQLQHFEFREGAVLRGLDLRRQTKQHGRIDPDGVLDREIGLVFQVDFDGRAQVGRFRHLTDEKNEFTK